MSTQIESKGKGAGICQYSQEGKVDEIGLREHEGKKKVIRRSTRQNEDTKMKNYSGKKKGTEFYHLGKEGRKVELERINKPDKGSRGAGVNEYSSGREA